MCIFTRCYDGTDSKFISAPQKTDLSKNVCPVSETLAGVTRQRAFIIHC